MRRHRSAFTLVELLVALAVGMLVIQIAFIAFFFIQKYIRRIERIDAMNLVAQSAVLWTITRPTKVGEYPQGAQSRNIGVLTNPVPHASKAGMWEYKIHDFNNPPYVHWLDKTMCIPVQP
jgi:hypothetical protein